MSARQGQDPMTVARSRKGVEAENDGGGMAELVRATLMTVGSSGEVEEGEIIGGL